MDEFNQQNEKTHNEDRRYQKQITKPKGRGIMSMISAGVIGGLLSLSVTQIPYVHNMLPASHQTNDQPSIQTSKSTTPALSNKIIPTSTNNSSQETIADTVQRVSKAIVGIENLQSQPSSFFSTDSNEQDVPTGSGSGIIFKKDSKYAYIVTNNHVIEGANELDVSLDNGTKTKAKVIGADPLTDLAVLKIDSKNVDAVASFGDSTKLRSGERVYAIGNPLGLDLSRTVTEGIVSAVNRSVPISTSAGNWNAKVIQTDAAINPGNSGGALINTSGQVVGINSLKISETGVEGIGFAIPSEEFIPIVNEIIKTGKVARPYMGVSMADLNQVPRNYLQSVPNNVTNGAYIVNIAKGSAADKAELTAGDVIVSLNGHKVENTTDLREYLYNNLKIGDDVKVTLYRNGKQITRDLVLESQPSN